MIRSLILFALMCGTFAGQLQAQHASLNHVAIYVKDVQVSEQFYKDIFGLAELPTPFPVSLPVKWMELPHGIALHLVGGRTERVTQPNWDHLAFAWGDTGATIARLDATGIPWESMDGKKSPQVRPDGVKQIFIRDPDGYWIEINDLPKCREDLHQVNGVHVDN